MRGLLYFRSAEYKKVEDPETKDKGCISDYNICCKMTKIQWKSRRVLGCLVGLFVLYYLIRAKKYEHKAFVFIPNTHPSDVWEFVADFSNMKLLNPTIVEFSILKESGNYDHWQYSTEYSEHLSHWPYLYNTATAHFNVKTSPKKDIYYIFSVHATCMLSGLYCLESKSEFRFSQNSNSNGAICEEMIEYECPPIFSSFCKREVIYQRSAIMNNLKKYMGQKS